MGDSMLLQSLAALLPLLLMSQLPDISAINTTSLQDCYRPKEKPCFAEKPNNGVGGYVVTICDDIKTADVHTPTVCNVVKYFCDFVCLNKSYFRAGLVRLLWLQFCEGQRYAVELGTGTLVDFVLVV